jgi:hypothetical protein
MKALWRKFYYSRFGQYMGYSLIYVTFWKFMGFEMAVIIGIGQIMGELSYQNGCK